MILARYWHQKGVVYDLSITNRIHKARAHLSICRKLNSGEINDTDVSWEVADLPRYYIHRGAIHDRLTPKKMAIYYHVDDYDEVTVPDYYKTQMDAAIEKMLANPDYRRQLSWTTYRIAGDIGGFRVPSWIKPGFVWSNHGNYWMWSEDKPYWNSDDNEYFGKSCRIDVPFLSDEVFPEWDNAKNSLYAVVN